MGKSTFIPTVNRIVIGDVGSGKTIVAFLAALSYLHGLKAASADVCLLAPTEVLAYQHYISLRQLVKTISTSTEYSTPTTIYLSSKQRYIDDEPYTKAQFTKKISELKESNSHIFWIGTHSLLHLENLTPLLVLVDEQHRFGVEQRKKLSNQNEHKDISAHFISFTATPIPRTLALTLFDSLKPHYLTTLTSRKPIKTIQQTLESFDSTIVPLIRGRVSNNEKVYIIVSKVQDK
jgi:ATP-dependent DNA helicase RecG